MAAAEYRFIRQKALSFLSRIQGTLFILLIITAAALTEPLLHFLAPRSKLRAIFDRKEYGLFRIRSLTQPQTAGADRPAFEVQRPCVHR
jgi:hypothetical protein